MKITILDRGSSFRLRIETKVSGERAFRYESFKTRQEAELRKAALLLEGADAPLAGDPTARRAGLCEYMAALVDEREATGSLAPTSLATYRAMIEVIRPAAAGLTIGTVSHKDVVRVIGAAAKQGYAPHTLKLLRQRIGFACEHARLVGLRRDNPAKKVPLPKVAMSAGRILSDAERGRLLAHVRHHHMGPVVRFALATGLRRGEICGLLWRNVDLEAGSVEVVQGLVEVDGQVLVRPPKSEAGHRRVGLPQAVRDELRALRDAQHGLEGDAVFLDHDGKAWRPKSFTAAVCRLFDAIGLDGMGPHDLRHCHASALLRSGMNLRAVAIRLGHADPSITLRTYSHCLPGDDAALTAAAGSILS